MTAQVINIEDRRTSSDHWYNSDHHATVVEFTPKLARCAICSSANHRSSKCPLRPRSTTRNAE